MAYLLLINQNETKKIEESINYLYENFEISEVKEPLFLDRKNIYYKLANKLKDGINFFEEKLKKSKENRADIYEYLFYEYQEHYEYNKAVDKMQEVIDNEKDKNLKDFLDEMKFDFIEEDYDDYF